MHRSADLCRASRIREFDESCVMVMVASIPVLLNILCNGLGTCFVFGGSLVFVP